MKTIVFVRHSNAEDGNYQLKDFDRQLTQKGFRKAEKIAGMCASFYQPAGTLFISSSAPRALQTATVFSDVLNYPKNKIVSDEFLYFGFEPADLQKRLAEFNEYDTVWLFGHNPMMLELLNYYTGRETDSYPKCMVVAVSFQADHFEMLEEGSGKAAFIINPKVV